MTERGYDGAGCGAIDDLRPPHVMASAQGVGAIFSTDNDMCKP